jgi:alkylation response protein AidB-like acyl-CoA dehydrogenase
MRLLLNPDEELFRQTTRRFLESEWPLETVRKLAADPDGFDRSTWQRGAELGWTSLLAPAALGGGGLAGAGLLDLTLVAEEMGRLVSPGPLLPANVVALALSGSDRAEHRQVLDDVMTGRVVPAWAVAEPGGRWSGDDVALSATQGPDGFVLDGVKAPVEAATYADYFLVAARTGDGLSQFLVPRDTPGVTVVPMGTVDLTRRYGTVRFESARVPATGLVGELSAAADAVERQLWAGLVIQCAETVGAIDRVFGFTVEYAFDRVSFGRPLASYQALKHRFADMKMWLEASAAAADGAARAVQDEAPDAGELVSAAKSYIGQHATAIVQDCVQLHGGIGVTWEHDIHLYLRRVTVNRSLLGTPEDHRERLAVLLAL